MPIYHPYLHILLPATCFCLSAVLCLCCCLLLLKLTLSQILLPILPYILYTACCVLGNSYFGLIIPIILKIDLKMRPVEYGKTTEKWFFGEFSGGSRGILGDLVFGWFLVFGAIPLLSFSFWSTILSAVPKIVILILISTACCGLGNSYI